MLFICHFNAQNHTYKHCVNVELYTATVTIIYSNYLMMIFSTFILFYIKWSDYISRNILTVLCLNLIFYIFITLYANSVINKKTHTHTYNNCDFMNDERRMKKNHLNLMKKHSLYGMNVCRIAFNDLNEWNSWKNSFQNDEIFGTINNDRNKFEFIYIFNQIHAPDYTHT